MPISGSALRQILTRTPVVGGLAAAGGIAGGLALGGVGGAPAVRARGIRAEVSIDPSTGQILSIRAAARRARRRRGARMPRVAADALRAQTDLVRTMQVVMIANTLPRGDKKGNPTALIRPPLT